LFFIDFYPLSFSPKGERFLTGGVEKVLFNHIAHK
jgi:hypothetical protein